MANDTMHEILHSSMDNHSRRERERDRLIIDVHDLCKVFYESSYMPSLPELLCTLYCKSVNTCALAQETRFIKICTA